MIVGLLLFLRAWKVQKELRPWHVRHSLATLRLPVAALILSCVVRQGITMREQEGARFLIAKIVKTGFWATLKPRLVMIIRGQCVCVCVIVYSVSFV